MNESKTVLEVLQATTSYFAKHAIESPRLNAEHLVAHMLGKKRIELYMEFDRPLGERELTPLRDLVKRRATGEPLQHLLGTVEFCGHTFLCDKRALIPRPETEQLVEMVIGETKSRFQNPNLKILDVGTGSGAIALSLAMALEQAHVHAVDFSTDALALAQENAHRLGLHERVRLSQSDLFNDIDERYDVIVANLPYIETEAIAALQREVQHDPRLALDGGADGAAIIRRFAADARQHLLPGGLVAIEVGHSHAAPLTEFFSALGYTQIRCKPDYAGVNRFLFANHG